ncbi:MAG: glycosyltransferase [Proteobacteria bacterium]|nr:glycosyltransferase [Pseudomonadota bacterium]
MRVAVITPYHREPEAWLRRCLASVRNQTLACEHLVIADGHPQDWLDGEGVRHIRLDRAHRDYGNTPRAIGALLAISEGFDAVTFLDADNWYAPEHIATCVQVAAQTGCDYVTASRHLCREDGSIMAVHASDDGDWSHVDTNCFFLLVGAFHSVARWALMPKPMALLGDRFYLQGLLADGLRAGRSPARTVHYLCTWSSFYRALGEPVPAFAKENIDGQPVRNWLARLQPGDLAVVRRLTGCALAT